jgi:hypothetical protein
MIKLARKIVSIANPNSVDAVRPQALIALLKDANDWNADAVSELALRDQVTPLADWIEIDLKPAFAPQRKDWLMDELSNALSIRQMQFGQLVILGWYNAACLALDLVLQGTLAGAGIVAVDAPCTPPRDPISVITSSIRIVLHEDQNSPAHAALVDALHRKDADIRLMTLPPGGPEARDITTRATAAFLSELTARACRPATE